MASNYYAALGVSPDAEPGVIRAAYKALMLKYHPDTNRTNAAAAGAKATQINEVYAILSDPTRRSDYDVAIRAEGKSASNDFEGSKGGNNAPPTSPPPPPSNSPAPDYPRSSSGVEYARGSSKGRIWLLVGLIGVIVIGVFAKDRLGS